MDTTSHEASERCLLCREHLVSIKFDINIDGLVESEFISAMEPQLAREIINMSLGANEVTDIPEELPKEEPRVEEPVMVQETFRLQLNLSRRSCERAEKAGTGCTLYL